MKFPGQVQEINGVIERLGMKNYAELAAAAKFNEETMRKWANGYQAMPDYARNAIQLVEQNRRLLCGQLKDSAAPRNLAASYSYMETATLLNSLSDLATKLRKVSVQDRKHVLGNLRAMLDELEDRELKGESTPSSKRASGAEEAGAVLDDFEKGDLKP